MVNSNHKDLLPQFGNILNKKYFRYSTTRKTLKINSIQTTHFSERLHQVRQDVTLLLNIENKTAQKRGIKSDSPFIPSFIFLDILQLNINCF